MTNAILDSYQQFWTLSAVDVSVSILVRVSCSAARFVALHSLTDFGNRIAPRRHGAVDAVRGNAATRRAKIDTRFIVLVAWLGARKLHAGL